MADYRLQIVTAQRTVFDQKITAGTFPGEGGYFGVLANHAPIVAVLKEGQVTIRRGTREEFLTITGGFFEMSNNEATLLVDDLKGLETLEGAKLE